MNAKELADQLCKDLVYGVYERNGRTFVATTLPYPNGDLITIYVSEEGGRTFASDMGSTHFSLTCDMVEITPARQELIDFVCALHEVEYVDDVLRRPITPETAGADVLSLCQAIVRVSNLSYDSAGRKASTFVSDVESLIEERVKPHRRYEVGWTHPELDRNGVWPVDYRFNFDGGSASNLFVAPSVQKVETTVSIVQHWQTRLPDFKSLCVVPDRMTIPAASRTRLVEAGGFLVEGLVEHERAIVAFALSQEPEVLESLLHADVPDLFDTKP